MSKIYFRKIKAGTMTLADVPSHWHDAVDALMLEFLATPEGQDWLVTHPEWRGE